MFHFRRTANRSVVRRPRVESLEARQLMAADLHFAAPVEYAAGPSPGMLRSGDFNHDGLADLAVRTSTGASILLGQADGTLGPARQYTATLGHIELGDLNNDGNLDLTGPCSNNLTYICTLLGNSDGTFGANLQTRSDSGNSEPVLADFNQDGKLDMALKNASQFLFLHRGRGDGTFDKGSKSQNLYPVWLWDLVAADINEDGWPDLAVPTSSGVMLVTNQQGDIFNTRSFIDSDRVYDSGSRIVAADFNGDGHADLAVRGSSTVGLNIYFGDGQGGFSPAVTLPRSSPLTGEFYAQDINGDGRPDLISGSTEGIAVYVNEGNGSFAPMFLVATGSAVRQFAGGDFDGDGDGDLAYTEPGSDSVFVLWQVPLQSAAIVGRVFRDFNENGIDDVEPPVPDGWTVYLDLNNSGTLDDADVATTTFGGRYYFEGLAAGTYAVRHELPPDWTATTPLDAVVTLAADEVRTGVSFGAMPPQLPPPQLVINDVEVEEGQTAVFTVTRLGDPDVEVSVAYATANGSAGGSDYVAASGTLLFAPGVTTLTISITTIDDKAKEGPETFYVNLSSVTGAVIADSQGRATILDNDGPKAKSAATGISAAAAAAQSPIAVKPPFTLAHFEPVRADRVVPAIRAAIDAALARFAERVSRPNALSSWMSVHANVGHLRLDALDAVFASPIMGDLKAIATDTRL